MKTHVLSSTLLAAGLVLALPGATLAQAGLPSKGSPEHIRAVTSRIDSQSIRDNARSSKDWPSYGMDYSETRFSKLRQLDTANVKRLGLVWSYDLESTRGVESTPVVVDGIMYVTASWSVVHAVDVRTGKRLWSYDPGVDRANGFKGCCDVVNRGVAVYKGKVYVGAFDGRLVALDAATGQKVWEQDTIIDRAFSYTITGAPRVIKGKVLIGNGGAEYGVRGYVTAYDAETGAQQWRWFTVPGDPSKPFENEAMARAAKTWDPAGKWWEAGGGGTAWDTMAYDPELNLMYIGTGNGSPWAQAKRSPAGGDNLYLASIVALNPDTGEYVWHYQETPGDSWDFTSTQPMVLADIKVGGKPRKVILHAPKNGFFFVIDRTNPIWPVHLGQELRRRELGQRLRRQGPPHRDTDCAQRRPRPRRDPQPLRRAQLAFHVLQPRHGPGLPAGPACAADPAGQQELEVQRRLPARAAQQYRLEHGHTGQHGAAQEHALRPPDRLGPGGTEGALARGACLALERRHAGHGGQPGVPGHGRRPLRGL